MVKQINSSLHLESKRLKINVFYRKNINEKWKIAFHFYKNIHNLPL